jgi:5'-deoxynucleotidase YfbR-like HD superfamily hydrolase
MAGLYGLLHDASEAYLGDVTKWVKGHPGMSWFREQEEILQRRVYEEFFLSPTPPKEISDLVDWADRVMVRFEGSSSYGHGPKFMKTLHDACGEERAKTHYPELTAEELEMVGAWKPWSWQQSEESFIVHHRMYSRS